MAKKSTEFQFDTHIHVDWKCTGNDIFGLLQLEYPNLACIHNKKANTLFEELARDGAEICMGAMAAHLESYGLALWNLDDGSDSYRLAIVPLSQTDEFVSHWLNAGHAEDEHESFSIEPEKVEPKPFKTKSKSSKSKKIVFIEDSFHHLDYGGCMLSEHTPFCWVRDAEDQDILLDVSTWPPQQVNISEQEIAAARGKLIPFCQSNTFNLWKEETTYDKKKNISYYKIADMRSAETLQRDDWSEPGHRFEDIYEPAAVFGDTVFLNEKKKDGGNIYRLKKHKTELLYGYDKGESCQLLALNEESCLVVRNNKEIRILGGALAQQDFHALPFEVYGYTSLQLLSTNKFFYFSEVQIPHEQRPEYVQRILQLNIYDLTNGTYKYTLLSDFVSEQKLNLKFLKSQPDDYITYRSFDGNLQVYPGHDSWWILNHLTNAHGKTDICWMWNAETDEYIKITPRDFPREEPSIHYISSLQRYVANHSCRLDLLTDINTILAGKEKYTFEWTTGR
jgi:hypothetical protein